MRKWSYLVVALGWTVSMVYEALFRPEWLPLYVTMGILVDAVLAVLFFWVRRKEKRQGAAESFTKGVYFAASVLLGALLALAVRQSALSGAEHIPLLPLYLTGILGALAAGIWLWRGERSAGRKKKKLPKGGA